MNKIVEDQLAKVQVAELPYYDETTLHMIIPKKSHVDFITGNCYLIQLEDYLIHPFEGFTLHDNWNKGIPPKHSFLKAEVIQIMGKMIKVNSIGFNYETQQDTDDLWEGWLPKKGLKIIQTL